MKKLLTFLIVIIMCNFNVNAQNTPDAWAEINSLFADGLYKSAIEKINVQYAKSLKNGDDVTFARAVIYRLQCQDYLEENPSPAKINSLRSDLQQTKSATARAIINSLLGENYWVYYSQNRWQFRNRTNVNDDAANTDVTTWSLDRIFAECYAAYCRSLQPQNLLQQTKVDKFATILEGDKETCQYRPTLYDLLAQRAVARLGNNEIRINQPREKFVPNDENLFTYDAQKFAALQINTSDTLSSSYFTLKTLQQLTQFHLQRNNSEAVEDLTLQRLKYLKNNSTLENKKNLYFENLKAFTENIDKNEIWIEAMYLLALEYNQKDEQSKAIDVCNKVLRESKNNKKKDFENLIKYIKQASLNVKIENVNIPNKPIKALIEFKNVKETYFIIYKLNANVFIDFTKYDNEEKLINGGKKYLEEIATFVKQWSVKMPEATDYKKHSTEIAVDALPYGQYILLTSNDSNFFDAKENIIARSRFQVSSIAFVSRSILKQKNEIYVTNRDSGMPLEGAQIRCYNDKNKLCSNATTNAEGIGIAKFDDKQYAVYSTITYKGETLYVTNGMNLYYGNNSDFRESYKTVFFLDRAIYRPGQTVYFKGFSMIYKDNKYSILPNQPNKIKLRDANGNNISVQDVVSNEYGTFSGTFTLPQNVLNGNFSIFDDISSYGNIRFRVEEYKRPTFEVVFDTLKTSLQFNKQINISGEAKAYAGYNIDGAKVSYNITRQIELPYRWWWFKFDDSQKQIAQGETTTDANGKFNVEFIDDGKDLQNDSQIANYNIYVEITDNNGETHSAQYAVRISKKPLIIETDIPETTNLDDELKYKLTTKNLNNNLSPAEVKVEIYSLQSPEKLLRPRLRFWDVPDKPLLSRGEYKKLFPDDVYENEDMPENFAEKSLIKTFNINTKNTQEINLSELKKYKTAYYKIKISAKNAEGVTAENTIYTLLQQNTDMALDMKYFVRKGAQTKNNVEFFVSAPSNSSVVRYEVLYRNAVVSAENINVGRKPQVVKIDFPQRKNDEEFAVNFICINNNRVYSQLQTISTRENNDLEISLVTFRNKMQPGEKEQWKLRVKSAKGEKATAEMVATLYDASLDAFAKNTWNKDFAKSATLKYNIFSWNELMNFGTDFSIALRDIYLQYSNASVFNKSYLNFINVINYIENQRRIAEEKKIEEQINNSPIKGFVTNISGEPIIGASIITNNGKNTATTNSKGKFGIDAKIGDVLVISCIGYIQQQVTVSNNNINIQLKEDANASVDKFASGYGAKPSRAFASKSLASPVAIRGVETMADKAASISIALEGSSAGLQINESENAPQPQIRTNFNETAFFYPELRTDENGEIAIDFTIPESLTRWNFLALANTKNLEVGTITAQTVTQKDVAISANAPRFFRVGDKIEMSAKINNITKNTINGKAKLQLFDALTMQPINIIDGESEQAFTVAANQSSAVRWRLQIPDTVDAITYRVTAVTENHSDGEEKSLPVLPNSMLVTESLPFTVRANQSKNFNFTKMLNNNSSTLKNYSYTLEFTSNPTWYAVQAMPYLMEYPFECSEQIFSRFYANSVSATLVGKYPQIKRTFDLWKMKDSKALLSNLEKNEELKNVILQETPWVREAQNESEAKKRIALLFDLNKMQSEQNSSLKKLEERQLPNGAFAWFSGMCESPYITQHIAIGLERLKKLQYLNGEMFANAEKISNAAKKYLDGEMLKNYKNLVEQKMNTSTYEPSVITLHYLYLHSFDDAKNLTKDQKTAFDFYLNQAEKCWQKNGIYSQAILAVTFNRLNKQETAQKIIRSLRERAKTSEEMGMYWSENTFGYFWYQAPIETQAALMEAFDEVGGNEKDVDEMKIWLLRNKQTNDWKTTKATADAIYALLTSGDSGLNNSKLLQVKLDNTSLEKLCPDAFENVENGTGYVKAQWTRGEVKRNFGQIEVENSNSNVAWGAAYWQYFENLDKITSAGTGVKIKREYFLIENTDSGAKLNAITENNHIKVGDKVKVRMELRADRDYEYVHLKDMRAAGFEPVNVLSRSKYQDGLWYYESTKDASTNFFIYYLPKGTYVFEYELRANNAGEFSTGIAIFQCMYAPEFSAHSNGMKIVIK